MDREETIYRQDVLDLAKKGVLVSNGNFESVCKAINELPSVNPQPCEDAISREDALMCLTGEIKETDTIETIIARFVRRIRKIPPVNPTKTGQWIPVSERLPEEDGLYLVYTEEQPFVCPFTDGEFFIDEVLAWMPLPSPFEPQERSDKA